MASYEFLEFEAREVQPQNYLSYALPTATFMLFENLTTKLCKSYIGLQLRTSVYLTERSCKVGVALYDRFRITGLVDFKNSK